MGNINPVFNDRVRFIINHKDLGNATIDEPIGWDTQDEKEFVRNEEYHGIFAKFSNSLKFVGNGYDYLFSIKQIYGIQTVVRLTKEEKHPKTDEWTKIYDGYLDMSTYEDENNEISVKFNSGGLQEMLRAREGEEIELSRTTTMDGMPLEDIETITKFVNLNGRKIFLKSKWQTRDSNTNVDQLSVFSESGNERATSHGYPFEELVYQSHEEAQAVSFESSGPIDNGRTGMMFIANVDRERTFRIRGQDIKFKTKITRNDYNTIIVSGNVRPLAYFQVNLTTFENGSVYDVKDRQNLIFFGIGSSNPNVQDIQNRIHNLNFDKTITLLPGESLSVEVLIWANLIDYSLNPNQGARFTVQLTERSGILLVDEDSSFPKTKAKFILANDYLERILSIITNKKSIFKSDFFTSGSGKLTGLTHGFWVRGFDALPISTEDNQNLFKPLTTSFKDAIQSFNTIWNVGLGIERVGYKELIVIEDLRYFYSRNVTIKLPNIVSKVKRSVATKYVYSGIEIGCEKGGDYSEAMGLDEYNGITKWNTLITVVKNTFSKISKYRTDSYGKEFARRQQISRNPTLDTAYDLDIFPMDLKKGIGVTYDERVWQDDFEEKPTGIYSPETATNLRFSPVNILLRHGFELSAALWQYPMNYIRYGSSTANSKLKTKVIGKDAFVENEDILNSELENPRYIADYVEFEHEMNFELLQAIEGFTMVNNRKLYNIYGLIEFKTDKGIERGWLINLKPSGTGKWKVLKFKN